MPVWTRLPVWRKLSFLSPEIECGNFFGKDLIKNVTMTAESTATTVATIVATAVAKTAVKAVTKAAVRAATIAAKKAAKAVKAAGRTAAKIVAKDVAKANAAAKIALKAAAKAAQQLVEKGNWKTQRRRAQRLRAAARKDGQKAAVTPWIFHRPPWPTRHPTPVRLLLKHPLFAQKARR